MDAKIIITYVLRFFGIAFVLVYFFGRALLLRLFPGLEGMSINPIFYTGVAIYLAGAVLYYFFNRKRVKKQ